MDWLAPIAAEEARAEGLDEALAPEVRALVESAVDTVFVQPIWDAAAELGDLLDKPLGAEPVMRAIRASPWAMRTVEDLRSPLRGVRRLVLHVPGRGNCLFDSIALGLQLHTLRKSLPDLLRQAREVALPPRVVPHGPCVTMHPDSSWNSVLSMHLRLSAVTWLAEGLRDPALRTNDGAITRAEVLQLNLPIPAAATDSDPAPVAPPAAADPDMALVYALLMGARRAK